MSLKFSKCTYFYAVYCTVCKETSIMATDSVEIEINKKVNNFQHGIDTYFRPESLYPYECYSKILNNVSH